MKKQTEIKKINAAVDSLIKARRDAGEPYTDAQEATFRRIITQAIAMAAEMYHYEDDPTFFINGHFVSAPGSRRAGPRYTPEQLGEGVARDLRRAGLGEKAANLMGELLCEFERGWLQDHPIGGPG